MWGFFYRIGLFAVKGKAEALSMTAEPKKTLQLTAIMAECGLIDRRPRPLDPP